MDFGRTFAELREDQCREAGLWLKSTFSPILTRWDAGEGAALLQLQLSHRTMQPVLHHRMVFATWVADRTIADGVHLVLHQVSFLQGEEELFRQVDLGDYGELPISVGELWEVGRRVQASGDDCQVALLQTSVAQALSIAELRPHLPERLRRMDFQAIASRPLPKPGPVSDGRRGGQLDALS